MIRMVGFEFLSSKKKEVKQSLYRPGQTDLEGSRRLRLSDFKNSAHEGGKVVSPTHGRFYAPGYIPGCHFF
jgi:hypothetical protein